MSTPTAMRSFVRTADPAGPAAPCARPSPVHQPRLSGASLLPFLALLLCSLSLAAAAADAVVVLAGPDFDPANAPSPANFQITGHALRPDGELWSLGEFPAVYRDGQLRFRLPLLADGFTGATLHVSVGGIGDEDFPFSGRLDLAYTAAQLRALHAPPADDAANPPANNDPAPVAPAAPSPRPALRNQLPPPAAVYLLMLRKFPALRQVVRIVDEQNKGLSRLPVEIRFDPPPGAPLRRTERHYTSLEGDFELELVPGTRWRIELRHPEPDTGDDGELYLPILAPTDFTAPAQLRNTVLVHYFQLHQPRQANRMHVQFQEADGTSCDRGIDPSGEDLQNGLYLVNRDTCRTEGVTYDRASHCLRLPQLAAGAYDLNSYSDGDEFPYDLRGNTVIRVGADGKLLGDEPPELILRKWRHHKVQIEIDNAETGAPVPGANVCVFYANSSNEDTTNEQGRIDEVVLFATNVTVTVSLMNLPIQVVNLNLQHDGLYQVKITPPRRLFLAVVGNVPLQKGQNLAEHDPAEGVEHAGLTGLAYIGLVDGPALRIHADSDGRPFVYLPGDQPATVEFILSGPRLETYCSQQTFFLGRNEFLDLVPGKTNSHQRRPTSPQDELEEEEDETEGR